MSYLRANAQRQAKRDLRTNARKKKSEPSLQIHQENFWQHPIMILNDFAVVQCQQWHIYNVTRNLGCLTYCTSFGETQYNFNMFLFLLIELTYLNNCLLILTYDLIMISPDKKGGTNMHELAISILTAIPALDDLFVF